MGIPGRLRAPDSALRGDMDRMANSMKQVPNPLPKVLIRRGVGAGMEAAERESFERTQVRTGAPPGLAWLGHPERVRCPRGTLKGVRVLPAKGRTGLGGWERRHPVRKSRRPGKVGTRASQLAWGKGQGGSEELAGSPPRG